MVEERGGGVGDLASGKTAVVSVWLLVIILNSRSA
jgi:hypothetical protein